MSLATVAESAGVSIATVSKVVNGRADVGPQTRARVQLLLDQHEYVGRRGAHHLDASAASPHAATVELVLHGELTSYGLSILEGVIAAGREEDVSVAVSLRPRQSAAHGNQSSAAWVRKLVQLGRRAVIDVVDDTEHGDLDALTRSRLPLVAIDPLSLPTPEITSVGTTNFAGGMSATQHLLDLGHRRIAFLGGPTGLVFIQARAHGYRAALEAAGVPVRTDHVVAAEGYGYAEGVFHGLRLLRLSPRPTAIFAATDDCAAGVIEAARQSGLRVPEDLSVVGFDDTPTAQLISPPLTTVRQPLREMGRVALQSALQLARGESLHSHHVELACELVLRTSTTTPPVG